ncbi:hypothetical protein QUA27_02755 [Microcoleus sp. Pol14C6]
MVKLSIDVESDRSFPLPLYDRTERKTNFSWAYTSAAGILSLCICMT